MEEAVFIKEELNKLYIRAQGHVTAAICPGLKARTFARLDTLPRIESIYIDLAPCEYMDSTFLGFIVGLNKKFKPLTGKTVVLYRTNETCKGLLRTIGVMKLIELTDVDIPFPMVMERLGPGPRATAEFLLDAHEELSEISTENKERFATLTETLRTAVGKGEKD